ncbi:MAG: class I SAM-dependent methyltransferase [Nanobdellota archaeon]
MDSAEITNLKNISRQSNYIAWVYDTIAPYLRGSILEVGAGVGALTSRMERDGHTVVPVDKRRYDACMCAAGVKNIDITRDVTTLGTFDSVVCLNVLEHIQDDMVALRNMESLMRPGGSMILMVPLYPHIYGCIDRANNHYRRYCLKGIVAKCRKTGLRVTTVRRMNLIGLLAWIYLNARGNRVHDEGELRRFDRMIPLIRRCESVVPLPWGLSGVVVAEK